MKKPKLPVVPDKVLLRLPAILLAVALLALALRECSGRSSSGREHRPSGGDTIDVALEYGPLSGYRYADTLGGFAHDLLVRLGATEGMTFKFHPVMTLDEALKGIDEGYYRIAVSAMPLSASLGRRYGSTQAVFLDRQVLVQRKDSCDSVAVETALDLAGKKVWVMAGSPVAERLKNLQKEIGDTIFIIEDSVYGNEQLFILAAIGEIERAVVTERTARILAKDYPEADISTAVSFTQFQTWLLCDSDTLLLHRVDSALTRVKSTPFYRSLQKKYLD